MKRVILLVVLLLSFGCTTVEQNANRQIYSELTLSGEITSDYNDWFRSVKGKSITSMTYSAKRELIKKLRVKRLGATVVIEEELERERKAKEAKLIAKAELEKITIDKAIDNIENKKVAFDNTGRIIWSNNHRQDSW